MTIMAAGTQPLDLRRVFSGDVNEVMTSFEQSVKLSEEDNLANNPLTVRLDTRLYEPLHESGGTMCPLPGYSDTCLTVEQRYSEFDRSDKSRNKRSYSINCLDELNELETSAVRGLMLMRYSAWEDPYTERSNMWPIDYTLKYDDVHSRKSQPFDLHIGEDITTNKYTKSKLRKVAKHETKGRIRFREDEENDPGNYNVMTNKIEGF